MNIQYVRLEDDVCGRLNEDAREQRRTVSDLVNEILRRHFAGQAQPPAEGNTTAPSRPGGC